MNVTTSKQDNAFVIALSGRIMGGEDTFDFFKVIGQAVAENFKNVVLDLGDVEWMNSTGLGMLISGNARVRDVGGILKLARLSDSVDKVLTLNKLNLVFEIHPTVEKAAASFK